MIVYLITLVMFVSLAYGIGLFPLIALVAIAMIAGYGILKCAKFALSGFATFFNVSFSDAISLNVLIGLTIVFPALFPVWVLVACLFFRNAFNHA